MAKKKFRRNSKQQAEAACRDEFDILAADLRQAVDLYAIRLEKLMAARTPTSTPITIASALDPLVTLQQVHIRAIRKPEEVHPLDATTAIQLAGAIGISPPSWALDTLNNTLEAKIQDKDVDLNQRLGFTAEGQGGTSEAERRIQENLNDQSCLRIWGLRLLGYKINKACWMEAGRLQLLPKNWNTTAYYLGHNLSSNLNNPDAREVDLYEKRRKGAERLRQAFYAFRTEIEKDPEPDISREYLAYLKKSRKEFLEQFPKN